MGKICNQPVYGIEEVKLQPLMQADALFSSLSGREKAHEQRYQRLLMQGEEVLIGVFTQPYQIARP